MKTKLLTLSLLVAFFFGIVPQAKADVTTLKSEDGWVKLTAMPSDDWGSYYYVIADWKQNLMLQLGMGANQGSTYNGVWYQTPKDPLEDQTVLWTMEKNVKSDGSITYNIWRSVAFPDYFLQTEKDKLWLYHTSDNGGGDKAWGRTIFKYNASGYFYVKNRNNDAYLGAWDDNASPDAMTAGAETALNKPSAKQGHYVVYAIKKTTYEALQQARLDAATEDTPQNVSWFIADPDMSLSATKSRWTVSPGTLAIGGRTKNRVGQFFDCKFDMYQTLSVRNGIYELKMQGFYRVGDGENSPKKAAEARNAGNEVINAYLYANNVSKPFPSVFDNLRTTYNTDYVSSTGYDIGGTTYYVPTNLDRASMCFSDGDYETSLLVTVTDGTLTIGVKKTVENSKDWTCFDNFRLIYHGPVDDMLAAVKDQAIEKLNTYAIDESTQALYDKAKADIMAATSEEEVAQILAQFDEDYKYALSNVTVGSVAVDLTNSLLKNADLTQGTTGWTAINEKNGGASAEVWTPYSSGTDIVTPSIVESYSGWSAHNTDRFTFTQQVYLSEGKYRLRGYSFHTSGATAQLIAGSNSKDVYRRSNFENIADCVPNKTPNDLHEASEAFGAGNYLNELIFEVTTRSAMTIGYQGTFGGKQQWFVAGPVTLEKISDAVLAAEAEAEVSALKALYDTRKTAYTAIAAQQTKAGVIFNTADADAAKTSATTKAEAESAINALGAALSTYMNEFTEDFNLTSLIKNPGFETATPLDWYCITTPGSDTRTHSIGEVGGTYYTEGFEGTRLFNTWMTSTTEAYDHYVLQRIDYLPVGRYALSASFAGDQSGAALRILANEYQSEYISCSDAAVAVPAVVEFYNNAAGRVRIGAKSDRWFKCDDFQLKYKPINITDWMAVDLGTVNLENDGVQQFLAEADYSRQGATSVVSNYTSKGKDLPRAIDIYLPSLQNTPAALTLTVSDKDDYSGTDTNTRSISLAPGTMHYNLYNTTPGYTYYYMVEADGTIVTQGTFTTEGTVRMIHADGGSNIRDFGGRITEEGKKVRYGRLYRGGEMHAGTHTTLTSAGIAEMQRLGIKAELDLRSMVDLADDKTAPSASALPGADYIYENLDDFSSKAFSDAEYRAIIKSSIEFVANSLRNGKPTYFHCVWGADRTGMIGMLLGATLGFSLDDIVKDYELTSFSKAGLRNKTGMDGKIAYVQANNQGNTIQEQLVDFLINTCGVSQADLDAIRAYMLEDDDDAMAAHIAALKAEYQKVITLAGATWQPEDITTIEALNTEYNSAMNALTDEIDMTSLLTNASFTDGTTGWTVRESVITNGKAAELYELNGSVRQALSYMPAGTYIVKAQGFQRIGNTDDSYTAYTNGSASMAAQLFANGNKLVLHNMYDDASNTEVRANSDKNPAVGVWVPYTLNGAGEYFDRNLYWNVLRTQLSSVGAVTLGIESGTKAASSWTCFDNFKVYYRGNSYVGDATLTLNDGQAVTLPTEDSYRTVTGNRTLKADRWNTVCLPFDMDAQAMEAAHMTDVRTLDRILVTDDLYTTVFTSASEIKAGKPYLVRVSEDWDVAGTNILVRAKQPVKVMKENGSFVGYYDPAMQISDIYYIGGNDADGNYFYHATNPVNLRGMRAYITLAAPAPASVLSLTIGLDDEDNPTGIGNVQSASLGANESEAIYDLTGRRVSKPGNGLYIVNGKKVMIENINR